ncbi:MAG: hypothetical protein M1819_003953 [Sarea resinae]|nr:MAG: hypothetical protein M1819_003953 [Sarea resinae]
MPAPREVFIAVLGVGGVGREFLKQLHTISTKSSQYAHSPFYLSLILVSSSTKTLYHPTYKPLPLSSCVSDLSSSTQKSLAPQELAQYLSSAPSSVVLVDNTSNQTLAESYPLLLSKGINIITPNKKAFSGPQSLWDEIQAATLPSRAGMIYHESTVGAGLPIISTLRDLVATGDRVRKIEGVFSGTMSYLFNNFAPVEGGGQKFSEVVKKAKELGYTEPDPRDDLTGLDVARKLTILSRLLPATTNIKVPSPTSFPIQSLIPDALTSAKSGDEFLSGLPAHDAEFDSLKSSAAAEGKVLRYVGVIDAEKGEVKVGLEKFEKAHPIAGLKGSDNIINFYTERYGEQPLVIRGAGAGAEVTAMGVTGDLLKVLSRL